MFTDALNTSIFIYYAPTKLSRCSDNNKKKSNKYQWNYIFTFVAALGYLCTKADSCVKSIIDSPFTDFNSFG